MHVTLHTQRQVDTAVLEKWTLPSLSTLWPQHSTLKRKKKKSGPRRSGCKRNKSREETAQGSQAGRNRPASRGPRHHGDHESVDTGAAALQRPVSPAALSWHLGPGLGRVPSTPQMETSSCLFLACLNKQRGLC